MTDLVSNRNDTGREEEEADMKLLKLVGFSAVALIIIWVMDKVINPDAGHTRLAHDSDYGLYKGNLRRRD